MPLSDYCVILVVDRFYGERLADLSDETPVWVVDSPINHPVIRDLWAHRGTSSHLTGITSFKDCPGEAPEDLAASMLDTIEEHHGFDSHNPPWNILRIIGANSTEPLQAEISRLGFKPIQISETALEFRR